MKRTLRVLTAACGIAALAATVGTEAQAACALTKAQGEGLTEALAQGMAKLNLDFAIAFKGAKASGPVRYSCAPGVLMLTSCTAAQRTCT